MLMQGEFFVAQVTWSSTENLEKLLGLRKLEIEAGTII